MHHTPRVWESNQHVVARTSRKNAPVVCRSARQKSSNARPRLHERAGGRARDRGRRVATARRHGAASDPRRGRVGHPGRLSIPRRGACWSRSKLIGGRASPHMLSSPFLLIYETDPVALARSLACASRARIYNGRSARPSYEINTRLSSFEVKSRPTHPFTEPNLALLILLQPSTRTCTLLSSPNARNYYTIRH